jgi:hypothetical protein
MGVGTVYKVFQGFRLLSMLPLPTVTHRVLRFTFRWAFILNNKREFYMQNNTCPQCKSKVSPTDRFCPACGAAIALPENQNPQIETTCWFCKKYTAEVEWSVPVKLAANSKEYEIDKVGRKTPTVPGTQRIGEKRILEYDVKTVYVPRCSHCGEFTVWNKKWANITAVASIGLPLLLAGLFSVAFPKMGVNLECFILLFPFIGPYIAYLQLSKRKRLQLEIPEKLNIHPKLAEQHPQVLALIEQGWQIGLPKGYKPA